MGVVGEFINYVGANRHRTTRAVFTLCFFTLWAISSVVAISYDSLVLSLSSFTLLDRGIVLFAPLLKWFLEDRYSERLLCASSCSHTHSHSHSHSHSHTHSHSHGSCSGEIEKQEQVSFGSESKPSSAVLSALPFRYARLEVVIQFGSGVFLAFSAFTTVVECLQRAIHTHEVNTSFTTTVSIVHILLLFFTRQMVPTVSASSSVTSSSYAGAVFSTLPTSALVNTGNKGWIPRLAAMDMLPEDLVAARLGGQAKKPTSSFAGRLLKAITLQSNAADESTRWGAANVPCSNCVLASFAAALGHSDGELPFSQPQMAYLVSAACSGSPFVVAPPKDLLPEQPIARLPGSQTTTTTTISNTITPSDMPELPSLPLPPTASSPSGAQPALDSTLNGTNADSQLMLRGLHNKARQLHLLHTHISQTPSSTAVFVTITKILSNPLAFDLNFWMAFNLFVRIVFEPFAAPLLCLGTAFFVQLFQKSYVDVIGGFSIALYVMSTTYPKTKRLGSIVLNCALYAQDDGGSNASDGSRRAGQRNVNDSERTNMESGEGSPRLLSSSNTKRRRQHLARTQGSPTGAFGESSSTQTVDAIDAGLDEGVEDDARNGRQRSLESVGGGRRGKAKARRGRTYNEERAFLVESTMQEVKQMDGVLRVNSHVLMCVDEYQTILQVRVLLAPAADSNRVAASVKMMVDGLATYVYVECVKPSEGGTGGNLDLFGGVENDMIAARSRDVDGGIIDVSVVDDSSRAVNGNFPSMPNGGGHDVAGSNMYDASFPQPPQPLSSGTHNRKTQPATAAFPPIPFPAYGQSQMQPEVPPMFVLPKIPRRSDYKE